MWWHRFGKLYIPEILRACLIDEAHRAAYSGHLGVDRTTAQLQQEFWWSRMRQTVRAQLRTCHECQVVAHRTQKQYGLLHPIAIPFYCWEQVTLDLITGLPKTRDGYDSCVVLVDRLSKMVHYVPCKKSITSAEMARLFVREVIRLHGWPKVLISDRDPRSDSDFWRAILAGSGCQLRMSTPYHPQTDGQTDRANRTLLAMLRKFCLNDYQSWEAQLP